MKIPTRDEGIQVLRVESYVGNLIRNSQLRTTIYQFKPGKVVQGKKSRPKMKLTCEPFSNGIYPTSNKAGEHRQRIYLVRQAEVLLSWRFTTEGIQRRRITIKTLPELITNDHNDFVSMNHEGT